MEVCQDYEKDERLKASREDICDDAQSDELIIHKTDEDLEITNLIQLCTE
jgi:hypothetical protein